MAIIKSIILDNGTTAEFHQIRKLSWCTRGICKVILDSWITELNYLEGKPAVHTTIEELSLAGSVTPILAAEQLLVTTGNYLDGGTMLTSLIGSKPKPLFELKNRAKELINITRDVKLSEPKTTSLGVFDATPLNLARIAQAADATSLKIAAGRIGIANKTKLTLANDSRSRFSLADINTIQLEMYDQLEAIFDTANQLRQQIQSATTEDQINAVAWP